MGPLDALWHLLNFLAPAVGVGAMAAGLAKLLWWRDLKPARWWVLSLWAAGASTLVLLAGLVVQGHDGEMATYAAMVLACAVALWWAAFGPGRR